MHISEFIKESLRNPYIIDIFGKYIKNKTVFHDGPDFKELAFGFETSV